MTTSALVSSDTNIAPGTKFDKGSDVLLVGGGVYGVSGVPVMVIMIVSVNVNDSSSEIVSWVSVSVYSPGTLSSINNSSPPKRYCSPIGVTENFVRSWYLHLPW